MYVGMYVGMCTEQSCFPSQRTSYGISHGVGSSIAARTGYGGLVRAALQHF